VRVGAKLGIRHRVPPFGRTCRTTRLVSLK
jgi:hypothetical protein